MEKPTKGGMARADARNEEKITTERSRVRRTRPVGPHIVISAIPRLLHLLSGLFGLAAVTPEGAGKITYKPHISNLPVNP